MIDIDSMIDTRIIQDVKQIRKKKLKNNEKKRGGLNNILNIMSVIGHLI